MSETLPQPNDSKVLVIGWDAADWRAIRPLLEAGKMPNLKKMMDDGVHGNVSTLNPILSPMLWSSIATGKRPYKHGIHGFSEPTPDGKSVRPITNVSRKSKAVWNMLNQTGKKCNVVAWWPSHPAEPIDGVMVSNWYQTARQLKNTDLDPEIGKPRPGAQGWESGQWDMAPGTVHPPSLAKNLQEFRFHPMELDAEHIGPFIPKFMEIDQAKDKRLEGLAKTLSDTVSVHGAATALMQLEPWDFMAVYYDGIDHFGHGFMKYHPPRQEWIKEEDFEIYKGVVDGGYQFHDMMLGALLHLAGEDATVILISDHGFHPDHLRPEHIPVEPAGPAIEHRPYGVFVARGPGIRKGETVEGASVLDLAPTVLTCFGLPVAKDMDGKPLVTIFEDDPGVETIPSWDDIEGPHPHGMHPPDAHLDSVQSAEAMKQLVELGYIDEPDEDSNIAVRETVRELNYNLAQAYMDGGHVIEAMDLLEPIWSEWPHEHRFGLNYIACLSGLERHEEIELAIHRLAMNIRSGSQWAAEEMETIRPLVAEYGVTLPRLKKNESDDSAQVAELDGDEPIATDEGDEAVEKKEMPKKLSFRLRKIFSLLQPMGGLLEWLVVTHKIKAGKTEGAGEVLAKVREKAKDGSNPDVENEIGSMYLKIGEDSSARECFERALEIDDENRGARRGLAEVAVRSEDWESAMENALTATELQFQDSRSHFLLGCALEGLGDLEHARVAFGVATQQAPGSVDAHLRMAELLDRMGETEEAASHREVLSRIEEETTRTQNGLLEDLDAVAASITASRQARRKTSTAGEDRDSDEQSDSHVTVVSGLPRSGTSMMMQMLMAGGIEPFTDKKREADSDNPRGYLEHEKASLLASDRSWLPEVRGMAVKIVAQLLPNLPKGEKYRIVFMDRDLREIVGSQKVMLDRLGKEGGRLSEGKMMMALDGQVAAIERVMQMRPDIEVLFVAYDDVLSDPRGQAERIARFSGTDLDIGAMCVAVDGNLKRQQVGG